MSALDHSMAMPMSTAQPTGKSRQNLLEAGILVLDDDIHTHAAVALCAGDLARVVHSIDIADILAHLHNIGSGVLVAAKDMNHLLCLIKEHHPRITGVSISKPINGIRLRQTLRDALARSSGLMPHPESDRHA